ncbi:MAG: ACT domain-containing protein, partial [Bacteroides sp.]
IAIGQKSFILGETDKNTLKEKSNANSWMKYLSFSFGNSKDTKPKTEELLSAQDIDRKKVLKLTEENIRKSYAIATCCNPIPGDDVLGYIDDSNHIIIHKRQCPVATKLKSSYGNRIIAASWDTHKSLSFPIYLYIKGIDSVGLLNQITQIISQQLGVNIRKLAIESNDGIFEGKIQLMVHDADDVKILIDKLRKINNLKSVIRVEE